MNIDDLTLGQVKELLSMLNKDNFIGKPSDQQSFAGLSTQMIGKKVIIRTYSAGCWFGFLYEKNGNEIILKDARRMWRWSAKESISLSAVAIHGIKHDQSKICEALESIWLEAIEIIPCTDKAIESLEGAPNVKAQ